LISPQSGRRNLEMKVKPVRLIDRRVLSVLVFIAALGIFAMPAMAAPIPVYGPTTLTQDYATYVLMKDIKNYGGSNPIKFEGIGITLNGNGHVIDGIGAPGSIGLDAQAIDPKIRNVKFTDWDVAIEAPPVIGGVEVYNCILKRNNIGIHYFGGDHGYEFSGNIIRNNEIGIQGSLGWQVIIRNNIIARNSVFGMDVAGVVTSFQIYNNYLKNQNNVNLEYIEKFNLPTLTSSRNIIGGRLQGGNFWGNLVGTGYSQVCTDVDKNGICDSPYVIGTVDNPFGTGTVDIVDQYPLTRIRRASAICEIDDLDTDDE
jgi:hypothetical protein